MNIKILQSVLNDIFDILNNIVNRDLLVDHIYYINLDKRTDRKLHIEKQIKTNFDFMLKNTTRIPGVIYNDNNNPSNINGAIGCSMAHYNVIQDAIKNNYEKILILEDDFEFICNKAKFFKDINYFFNNYKNFDIFLLSFNAHKSTKVTDLVEIVEKSLSTSGYIVSKKTFQSLMNACTNSVEKLKKTKLIPKGAFDVLWHDIMRTRKNTYKFNYRIGKQIEGYSDICKKKVNYGA
jgi:GR25 family glycosyltransferase involved in LPS biosynthesis